MRLSSLRRGLLLGTVGACAIVLLLAAFGVWEEERAPLPPPPPSPPGPAVIKDVVAPLPEGTLRARQGVVREDGTFDLTEPVIETVDRSRDRPEDVRRIIIRAKHGTQRKHQDVEFQLEGDVRAEIESADGTGCLETDRLHWNHDKAEGKTDSVVSLTVVQQGASNVVTGRGVFLEARARRVRVGEDVRMVITREEGLLPITAQAADKTPLHSGEKLHITCAGEMIWDGAANRITLKSSVVANQGKARLAADKLELHFDPHSRKVQQVTASGRVRMADPRSAVECMQLTRSVTDGETILQGEPECRVTLERTTIVAERVIVNEREEKIEVPSAGRLSTATRLDSLPKPDAEGSPPRATANEVEIVWKGGMSFDQRQHRAVFERDIVLTDGPRSITCKRMTLEFDEHNERVLKIVADKYVHMKGPEESAKCDRLVAMPADGRMELTGEKRAQFSSRDVKLECAKIALRERGQQILCSGAGVLTLERKERSDTAEGGLTVRWRESMSYDMPEGRAEFVGGVACGFGGGAGQSRRELNAEKVNLVIELGDQLAKIEAEEKVRLVHENGEAKGDKLVWELAKDEAILTGKPASLQLTGQPSITGDVIHFAKNFTQIRMEKPLLEPPGQSRPAPRP